MLVWVILLIEIALASISVFYLVGGMARSSPEPKASRNIVDVVAEEHHRQAMNGTLPVTPPRPRFLIVRVFGYLIESDWIVERGRKHNDELAQKLGKRGTKKRQSLLDIGCDVVSRAADGEICLVKETSSADVHYCLAIASTSWSSSMEGKAIARDEKRVKRLRECVGREEDPEWYEQYDIE
ncbi:hypothetical protein DFH11DRAFT_864336 [Phellopilus nigrolimitatus]|nr:hypothetical protein DFH11DRAFT_864336 [Phellopilus nigrolimitatus]